ncbi:MAG: biotin--[acetyl-CoA-carboxylase] ligase [Burkholderiales bacterium]|jgi:BirA family biotin operon repressor/biotin-[acetyl-CoA-carboxylase] ligase|uniref:biotin--[acetyl-CoA-carboxylase] ligase n=1 Tax=Limnobacter sp. TaxID=2003368 RepID=UPI0039288DFD|nr:biotin--[acetyl-CoA-carboxylase] ligase [Burkholderiales bacterium]
MLTQANVHWIELDSVDSTNDYLACAYQQGSVSGVTAVLAHMQTAGRGRAGRQWQAQPGASLCMSLGLPIAGHQIPFLPLCVGVAVAHVLEQLQVPVRLKWPNDLLVGQQKLGGVLCESFQTAQGAVTVVGVGLNIQAVDVPGALSGQGATCLSNYIPGSNIPSLTELAQSVVSSVLKWVQASLTLGIDAIFSDFSQFDSWLHSQVQVEDRGVVCFAGEALGIDRQGAYLVNTDQGLRAVHAGDLSLRVRP